jgi:hypothetical protein
MTLFLLSGFASCMGHAALDRKVWRVSTRKVGGIRFVKVGRLTMSFCVSKEYKAIKGA